MVTLANHSRWFQFCPNCDISCPSRSVPTESRQFLVHNRYYYPMGATFHQTNTSSPMLPIQRGIQHSFYDIYDATSNQKKSSNRICYYIYDFLYVFLSCAWKVYLATVGSDAIGWINYRWLVGSLDYCGWLCWDVLPAERGRSALGVFWSRNNLHSL